MDDSKEIKLPKIDLSKIKLPITIGLASFIIFLCIYTVDANEQAVVLRLGKYLETTNPGLHFKIPFFDSVYKQLNYFRASPRTCLQKLINKLIIKIIKNHLKS